MASIFRPLNIPTLQPTEFPIPPSFARVVELAYNLWWSWNSTGASLWSNLDPVAWESHHNPIELLESIEPSRWQVLGAIEAVQDRYLTALTEFNRYLNDADSWYSRQGQSLPGPVAYLCTEFGVHSSVPFYSGGLGILAGDHLKSASDLGLPLIGIGLLFRRGYFRQEVEAGGEQQHIYPTLDVRRLPVKPVASPSGGQLKVEVEFPGRIVRVAVWKLDVGRVPLILLDTDIPENDLSDRPITHTLYVRGREMRFCQEMILGIGGVRALEALAIEPSAWHVNEGHAAMAFLDRIRREKSDGDDLAAIKETIRAPEPVHPAHAGPGRQRGIRHWHRCPLPGSPQEEDGHDRGGIGRTGVLQRRYRPIRPGSTGHPDVLGCQWSQQATRRDRHPGLAASHRRSGPGGHQRRPYPNLDRA